MDSETKPIRTYWYVAWFRDTTQPADDQDYEWPDCILIDAASADLAKLWGDELSRRFSRNQETELFLWSKTEDYNPDSRKDGDGKYAVPKRLCSGGYFSSHNQSIHSSVRWNRFYQLVG